MEKRKNYLIVEGSSDAGFIKAFLKKWKKDNLLEDRNIIQLNGYDKINAENESPFDKFQLHKPSIADAVGVMIDADDKLKDRVKDFETYVEKWFKVKLNVRLTANGYVETIALPPIKLPVKLGLFVLPNNKEEGALETLLKKLLKDPKQQQIMQHCTEFVKDAVASGMSNLPKEASARKLDKSDLHCWLALQRRPALLFGDALHNDYLNINDPAIAPLKNWLKDLYE